MRRAAWVAAFGLVAVAVLFAASSTWPTPDEAATGWVRAHLDAGQREAWRDASWPGATLVGLAVAAAAAVACAFAGARREALGILGAASTSAALVALLKDLLARERPPGHGLDSFAFPSGHAAMATVAYGLVALVAMPVLVARWPRLALARPMAIGVWLGFAGAVGVARVLAGVHWPSDVLGGWAWGAAVLASTWMLSNQEHTRPTLA